MLEFVEECGYILSEGHLNEDRVTPGIKVRFRKD